MRRQLPFTCLVAPALALGMARAALACEPPPPPEPPPRTAAESESDFAARSSKWYSHLSEAERVAALPGRIAREDRLWANARRVALARLESIDSIRLRGSEGQWYKSPLARLRALRWLKGNPSPRTLKVHYLSDNSCDFGGVGEAADGGEVGGVYLVFYGDGPIEPRNVLYTFGKDRVVTPRSREAFGLAGSRPPARRSDGKGAR
jgi:hypothetical protein